MQLVGCGEEIPSSGSSRGDGQSAGRRRCSMLTRGVRLFSDSASAGITKNEGGLGQNRKSGRVGIPSPRPSTGRGDKSALRLPHRVTCEPQGATRTPVGLPRLPAGRLTTGSLYPSFEPVFGVVPTLTAGQEETFRPGCRRRSVLSLLMAFPEPDVFIDPPFRTCSNPEPEAMSDMLEHPILDSGSFAPQRDNR